MCVSAYVVSEYFGGLITPFTGEKVLSLPSCVCMILAQPVIAQLVEHTSIMHCAVGLEAAHFFN